MKGDRSSASVYSVPNTVAVTCCQSRNFCWIAPNWTISSRRRGLDGSSHVFVAHTAQRRIFRSHQAGSLITRPDRIEVFNYTSPLVPTPAEQTVLRRSIQALVLSGLRTPPIPFLTIHSFWASDDGSSARVKALTGWHFRYEGEIKIRKMQVKLNF